MVAYRGSAYILVVAFAAKEYAGQKVVARAGLAHIDALLSAEFLRLRKNFLADDGLMLALRYDYLVRGVLNVLVALGSFLGLVVVVGIPDYLALVDTVLQDVPYRLGAEIVALC